jgi:AraC family ethanolamine operon transcriptional activator
MLELCSVAHASERKLRESFTGEYGLPPSRFFRAWALQRVHRMLRDPNKKLETITMAAATFGFYHQGRFASYYKQLHGETPSATLRSVQQSPFESTA